jgi:hypothetical protein
MRKLLTIFNKYHTIPLSDNQLSMSSIILLIYWLVFYPTNIIDDIYINVLFYTVVVILGVLLVITDHWPAAIGITLIAIGYDIVVQKITGQYNSTMLYPLIPAMIFISINSKDAWIMVFVVSLIWVLHAIQRIHHGWLDFDTQSMRLVIDNIMVIEGYEPIRTILPDMVMEILDWLIVALGLSSILAIYNKRWFTTLCLINAIFVLIFVLMTGAKAMYQMMGYSIILIIIHEFDAKFPFGSYWDTNTNGNA